MFKGSIVALITHSIMIKLNEENYVKLIHHHLENGTNGVVPAGTTGESQLYPTVNIISNRISRLKSAKVKYL